MAKYLALKGDCRCDGPAIKEWEILEVRNVRGNIFTLKGPHGKYISAQPNGDLRADGPRHDEWEEFTLHEGDDKIAFLGCHGKWISAQPNGDCRCDGPEVKEWELFEVTEINESQFKSFGISSGIHPRECTLAFRGAHGKYLSPQPNGDCRADGPRLDAWEHIKVKKGENERLVRLKGAHGKYISSQPDGSLTADSDGRNDRAFFEYIIVEDKVTFRGIHGKWISAQPSGSCMCDSTRITKCEYFQVQDLEGNDALQFFLS